MPVSAAIPGPREGSRQSATWSVRERGDGGNGSATTSRRTHPVRRRTLPPDTQSQPRVAITRSRAGAVRRQALAREGATQVTDVHATATPAPVDHNDHDGLDREAQDEEVGRHSGPAKSVGARAPTQVFPSAP